MDAISTVTLTTADLPAIPTGTAYRINQHADDSPSNPLEDQSNITSGYIHGASTGHINAEWDADTTYALCGPARAPRRRTVTAADVRRALHSDHGDNSYQFSPATVARWLRAFHGARGVYAVDYTNSGPRIDTTAEAGTIMRPSASYPRRTHHEDGWTSAGWARIGDTADGLVWTPADVIAENSALGFPPTDEQTKRWASGTIDTYRAWCEGDVFGYTVERLEWDEDAGDWIETGDEVGACWGFYGDDGDVTDPKSSARDHAMGDIGSDIPWRATEATAALEKAEADRLERDAQIREDRAADREAVYGELESAGDLSHVAFVDLERAAELAIAALITRGSLAGAPDLPAAN